MLESGFWPRSDIEIVVQHFAGESPSPVAIRRLKDDPSLWRGKERLVSVRTITIPFSPEIQTLEQGIAAFTSSDKDRKIYPLAHSV